MSRLDRLLRPKSIAVIGGGFWGENVIEQCKKIGFTGPLYAVHPKRSEVGGVPTYPSIDALPEAPDAVFIGVNWKTTIDVVESLSGMGAGGAVCFASGFSEIISDGEEGHSRQRALTDAAGDMPVLGPNCYGFINYLDGAALWPDQHGGKVVDQGVAIITQSSNILINLTMQKRALPIAYAVAAGNQAQTELSDIAVSLLSDDRVTALGLHIEGIGDLQKFEVMAATAHQLGKPIVALKVGLSEQARTAAVSHTASLAGSNAGADALLSRLGIGRAQSLGGFLESLKLIHLYGPLKSPAIASMSCSGGEAALMSDAVEDNFLHFPPLSEGQKDSLRSVLGAEIALNNPLDYHTQIWGDEQAMSDTFAAMLAEGVSMGCVVLDFPRDDRCSQEAWFPVINSVEAATKTTGKPLAIISSLPETMPEEVSQQLMTRGIIPLNGMAEGLEAIEIAARMGGFSAAEPLLIPEKNNRQPSRTLTEADGKAALKQFGLSIPNAARANSPAEAAEAAKSLSAPLVLKGEGVAHKSEAGFVRLNLMNPDEVKAAALQMNAAAFLIEEMVPDALAELLIGITRDGAHGYVLTIAAGGTLTELLEDSASLLVPTDRQSVATALSNLKIARLLKGYRGKNPADIEAIIEAVMALQSYVKEHRPAEVEINPLLCCADRAVAVDALIRFGASDD